MKKLFSLAMVMIMALALCVPAFAAEITVTNAVDGETYTAYKVFDYTKSGSNFAYTISSNSVWKNIVDAYTDASDADVFTLTASASDPTKQVVTVNEGADFTDADDAALFAEYLMKNLPTNAPKTEVTADDGVAKFDGLDAGYYFVDTTLGALCSLFNFDTEQKVEEKNTIPSQEKKIIVNDGTTTSNTTSTTATIGDTIDYQITVTDSKGTDKAITVHDKMDDGLTLDEESIVIKVNDQTVPAITVDDERNYEIKFDVNHSAEGDKEAFDCTFEIVFSDKYVASLEEGTNIVITYSAVLNKNADVENDAEHNTSWLTYSNQTTTETKVTVYTYDFDLVKTVNDENGKTVLSGAKFKLYDNETEGNEIPVVKTADGVYRVAVEGETGVEIEAGQATIQGLGNGTYWLEETQAPAGYNLLTARQKVEIDNKDLDATVENNAWVQGGVRVINQSGFELPSTGGMGTTIFYTVGGILMAGAAILLITKKKMANEQ